MERRINIVFTEGKAELCDVCLLFFRALSC